MSATETRTGAQSQEAISISFGAKLPGTKMETETVELAFDYESATGRRSRPKSICDHHRVAYNFR